MDRGGYQVFIGGIWAGEIVNRDNVACIQRSLRLSLLGPALKRIKNASPLSPTALTAKDQLIATARRYAGLIALIGAATLILVGFGP